MDKPHHTSGTAYLVTWIALIVLTTATFLLSRVDLGGLQVPVALTIAAGKGLMVVLVFMHLLELRSVNRVFFLMAVLFIVLLASLMVADVARRIVPAG
jgi:cytochrome c oxidase subunit 4